MRDLDDVLNGGLEARERELTRLAPSAGNLDRMLHGVRRRRARRHAMQGVAALATLAVVGSAGWWGLHRDTPQPALTPTPTATASAPTPTPTPTPTPRPTPTANAISLPGLPDMPESTPALLAQVGPGWVATVYEPERWTHPDEAPNVDSGFVRLANAVILVAPDGTRYHLMDLALTSQLHLDSWVDGGMVVDGTLTEDGVTRLVRLDLRTGELESGVPLASSDYVVGVAADGRFLVGGAVAAGTEYKLVGFDGSVVSLGASSGWANPKLSPGGTRLVLDSTTNPMWYIDVDLGAGASTTRVWPGLPDGGLGRCGISGWFDDESFLAVCGQGGFQTAVDHPVLCRIFPDGLYEAALAGLGDLAAGDPVPQPPTVATADGVVAWSTALPESNQWADPVSTGTWLWTTSSGDRRQLTTPDTAAAMVPFGVVGDDVYLAGAGSLVGDIDLHPSSLWVLRGGKLTQLVPGELLDGVDALTQGATSFVVRRQ